MRTEHDPVQLLWERGESLEREADDPDGLVVRDAMLDYLASRGEPARYLHVHAAGLLALTEAHELKKRKEEFDAAFKRTQSVIETGLSDDPRFVHYSSGEDVEAGLWSLRDRPAIQSLPDRVEVATVNYLQKHPDCIYLEIESELYRLFPGLLTPSKGMLYAILRSYAEKSGANWRLRHEDVSSVRQGDLRDMNGLVERIGKRLGYATRKQDKWLIWEEKQAPVLALYALASAVVSRVIASNPAESLPALLIVPGGRAALIAYKEQRDPALAERMQSYRVVKFRLWRGLVSLPLLTRETFEEQLSSDPIKKAEGQMMMF